MVESPFLLVYPDPQHMPDTASTDTAVNVEATDQPASMVNADPVSPDMTAAILDAQGAMSEEDEK